MGKQISVIPGQIKSTEENITTHTRSFRFSKQGLVARLEHGPPDGKKQVEYTDLQVTNLKLIHFPLRGDFYSRFTYRHRRLSKKLGSWPAMSVSEARLAAQAHRWDVQSVGIPKALKGEAVSFADYLLGAYLDIAKKSKRSWRADQSKIHLHLIPFFGNKVRLADLTYVDVEAYIQHLLAKGLAKSTTDRHLALICAVYREAIRARWVNSSPASGIAMFNPDNANRRFLNRDELDRLIKVCRNAMTSECCDLNSEVAALAIFLASTGMRVGEALGLTFDLYNPETKTFHLSAAATKAKKARDVPICSVAEKVLFRQKGRHGLSGFVFRGKTPERPMSANSRAFKKILKAAELDESISFHSLRKSYLSHLLMAGVDIYTVSKLAGHASVVITERAYAFLSQQALLKAAENVESFISLDDF
ncbi:MAG: tyrosine-type recombinase/integrase [Amphritea sp.]